MLLGTRITHWFSNTSATTNFRETKELRRELAEQRETNQRLSALYHSRIMDEDDGYRYGVRRSKHSAVGVNDQARCFGHKCTIM